MANKAIAELMNAPLPELVERLGTSIADAQFALDKNSVAIAQTLADAEQGLDLGDGYGPRSLLELGFTPTFYQITEATVEARVAFTLNESESFSIGASVGVNVLFFAASVNASYSAKYSFEASGSSQIRAKFVSIPPPAIFSELLRSTIRGNAES
ncbi:MAG: hypothetical protein LBG44_10065 [Gemmatimonadota bacterium]|jgi:hypothetical protein|nr:hypothetical protein [Gemmatimonadota bacterium]